MPLPLTDFIRNVPDGVEVENNVAVPQIPYEITPADFTKGYVPYRQFYTEKVLELIKQFLSSDIQEKKPQGGYPAAF